MQKSNDFDQNGRNRCLYFGLYVYFLIILY